MMGTPLENGRRAIRYVADIPYYVSDVLPSPSPESQGVSGPYTVMRLKYFLEVH